MAHIVDGTLPVRGWTQGLDVRPLRLVFSAALTLSLMLGVAPSAVAAGTAKTPATTSASSDASKPVDAEAGGSIDVQIWPQASNTAIITVVEVDSNTKLPVTVRVPIMPGSTVEWAGEIMGGQASSDIEQPFKLRTGRGGQFAEFTLTKSRRGQVDAIGFPLTVVDQTVSLSVEYVQSVSSTMTAMSVRLPADISKVKITPKPDGEPVLNADRESLYVMSPKQYELGETEKVDVSYSTVPPVVPAPGSELTPVLIGLGAALVVAVVIVLVLITRQSQAAQAAQAERGEEDESDEGEDPDDDAFDDDDTDLTFT